MIERPAGRLSARRHRKLPDGPGPGHQRALLITFTYGYGVALAAFAGVLAAPMFQVNPLMGSNLIIVVFAVVVIGGMGSILGSIVTGLGLGLIEGLTRVFYPEASAVVVFVIMVIVLLVRPCGSVRQGLKGQLREHNQAMPSAFADQDRGLVPWPVRRRPDRPSRSIRPS
jgi:hypothetical protein